MNKGKIATKLTIILNSLLSLIPYSQKKKLLKIHYIDSEPGNCGIACVAMIIQNSSIGTLINKYKKTPFFEEPLGWNHKGLIKIFDTNGYKSKILKTQTIIQLRTHINKNHITIVSLTIPNPNNLDPKNIYQSQNKQNKRVRHLCVLTGYNQKGFYLHDPRNIKNYSKNVFVPYKKFSKIFNGNGILVIN